MISIRLDCSLHESVRTWYDWCKVLMQRERTLEKLPDHITFITLTPGSEEEVLVAFNRRSISPYYRVCAVTGDLKANTHLEDVCCSWLIDWLVGGPVRVPWMKMRLGKITCSPCLYIYEIRGQVSWDYIATEISWEIPQVRCPPDSRYFKIRGTSTHRSTAVRCKWGCPLSEIILLWCCCRTNLLANGLSF